MVGGCEGGGGEQKGWVGLILQNIRSFNLFQSDHCAIQTLQVVKNSLTSVIPTPGHLDTGRKLNVHQTFKRNPGCLLNVLCTFSLRPGVQRISLYWTSFSFSCIFSVYLGLAFAQTPLAKLVRFNLKIP